MTLNQIIKHFGTLAAASRALEYNRNTFYYWRKRGVPMRTQYYIERITNRALVANIKHAGRG